MRVVAQRRYALQSCSLKTEYLEIFQGSGALLTGHFQLRSGLHSDRFLQTAVVLQYPEYASALGAEIAARVEVEAVDIVIGPAIGGVILAYEVARALGARALFGEKSNDEMILRPGFKIEPRDRIVVVDDVLTTGGSVFKLIRSEPSIPCAGGGGSLYHRPQCNAN